MTGKSLFPKSMEDENKIMNCRRTGVRTGKDQHKVCRENVGTSRST